MNDDEQHEAHASGPRSIHVGAAAGWTIAVSLLVFVLAQITESLRPGALSDLVNFTACHTLAYSLVLFITLRLYAPASPMRDALAFRPVSPLHVILSAIAGAGISPAMSALDDLVLQHYPASDEIEQVDKMLAGEGRGVLIASLVVFIPIAEELFYRGMLYGGIKRGRSTPLAMLATAALFAASRFDARWAWSAFVLGMVLAWLRSQSGSVVSSCVAHAAFYAMPLAPMVMGRQPIDHVPVKWIAVAMGAAIVALVLGSFLGARDGRAIAARARDE